MKAFCITNLDDYKHEEWPEEFNVNLAVGHYVESKSGKRLKVVAITHVMLQVLDGSDDSPQPVLKVELHQ